MLDFEDNFLSVIIDGVQVIVANRHLELVTLLSEHWPDRALGNWFAKSGGNVSGTDRTRKY